MNRSDWIGREERSRLRGLSFPQTLDYPEPIKRLLLAREILDLQEIEKTWYPKLSSLKEPLSMLGMAKAVDRLLEVFKKEDSLCIYADFDLDGTSGLALLYEGLIGLGFKNVSYYQPKRLSEGYGFHPHATEELAAKGVKLIVTVDVGITAVEAVEKANELGVDVIISDHHQAKETLPKAYSIINPNQKGDQSGLGYLCGAGTAFYLLRAMKRRLVDEGLIDEKKFDLKSVLDFLAIGTLTDLVPLVDDNRVLVKFGLLSLSQTQRPGFKALLQELGLGGRNLSGQDISIRFAPKLNALSRMEKKVLPIDIMLEKDWPNAVKMIDEVIDNNDERVNHQIAGEQEAIEFLKTWPHEKFFFFTSKNLHQGVVGLIATKLAQLIGGPAFVGCENLEGTVVGSARTSGASHSVLNVLEASREYLNRFGGHHAAAGFEFFSTHHEKIVNAMAGYFENQAQPQLPPVEYDFSMPLSDVSENVMKWIDALGPFGQSFPAPQFLFTKMPIKSIFRLRGGHLKLSFREAGRKIEALYFSPPTQLDIAAGDLIDFIAELQWNYYNNSKQVQLLIRDVRPSEVGVLSHA
jgi:single-stranded-DNA-specific exonuclease